jgi:hypothetical protein
MPNVIICSNEIHKNWQIEAVRDRPQLRLGSLGGVFEN